MGSQNQHKMRKEPISADQKLETIGIYCKKCKAYICDFSDMTIWKLFKCMNHHMISYSTMEDAGFKYQTS